MNLDELTLYRPDRENLAKPETEKEPDLLLINTPFRFPAGWPVKEELSTLRSFEEPPTGILRIASMARQFGIKSQVLDAHKLALSLKQIILEISRLEPKIVGLNPTSLNIGQAKEIYQYLVSIGVPIIIGGVFASLNPRLASSTFPEAIIVNGDGAGIIAELVDNILTNSKTRIPGVYTLRDISKIPIDQPIGHTIEVNPNFIEVDYVNLTEKPLSRYFANIYGFSTEIVQLDTYISRGCPFSCTFCASPVLSRLGSKVPVFHRIEPWKFIAEIEAGLQIGATAFHFLDDNLIMSHLDVERLSNAIVEKNFQSRFYWKGLTRVSALKDVITYGNLQKLKETGCYDLAIGFESGSTEVLKKMHKGHSPEDALVVAKALTEQNISFRGLFILGLPNETEEQMLGTISHAVELARLGMRSARFFQFKPYPGTADTQNLIESDLKWRELLELGIPEGSSDISDPWHSLHDNFLPDDWPSVSQLTNLQVKELVLKAQRDIALITKNQT